MASTCSEPSSNRRCIAMRHDLVLAHARPQHAVDVLVDRVHDRRRVLEQRDLVRGLERTRAHHHGLRVGRLDALAVQREERLHVGQVDAQRLAGEPALRELAVDASGERIGHARLARHRAAHRRDARLPARLRQPRRVQLVVLGGRAEVPQHRVALARQQHAARALVARPLADVRARDVADVVLVEQQHRAEARTRAATRAPSPAGRPAASRSRSAAPSRPPSSRRATRCSWSRSSLVASVVSTAPIRSADACSVQQFGTVFVTSEHRTVESGSAVSTRRAWR